MATAPKPVSNLRSQNRASSTPPCLHLLLLRQSGKTPPRELRTRVATRFRELRPAAKSCEKDQRSVQHQVNNLSAGSPFQRLACTLVLLLRSGSIVYLHCNSRWGWPDAPQVAHNSWNGHTPHITIGTLGQNRSRNPELSAPSCLAALAFLQLGALRPQTPDRMSVPMLWPTGTTHGRVPRCSVKFSYPHASLSLSLLAR